MYRYISLSILLFAGISGPCWSQRIISLAESFTIQPHTEGRIECLLPQSLTGRQTLLEVQYSRLPNDTILKHGGLYAVWKIKRSLEGQHVMVISTLRLSENSLRKSNQLTTEDPPEEYFEPYLQPEELIQSGNKGIEEAARGLRDTSDLETTRNVFHFVVDHLEYYNFYNQRQGAKKALSKGRGDCTEYAELMVALLRNLGIPAREAVGHTIHQKKEKKVGYHSWVEVYLQKLGWVTFDPTWADHEKSFTTFDRMKNAYVLLGYGHAAERHRFRVSGVGSQIKYDADWEDPTIPIEGRVHLALWKEDISSANKSLDTLLSWLPDNPRYIALRAKAKMKGGYFEQAFPLIQLSIRKADNAWVKQSCMLNLASYLANTGKKKEALDLLLALEKENDYNSVPASSDRLYSPLSDEKDFQSLVVRGKALRMKMQKEFEAREAKANGENQ